MLDDTAVVAAELQLGVTRLDAVDRVEERVEVHETAELPVGHTLQPELLLACDDPSDRLVL